MDSPLALLGLNLVLAIAVMATLWLVSLRLRDVSIVDIAWGAVGALMAVSALVMGNGAFPRRLLITGMTVIWGCRLAFHIGVRKRGKGEDSRYAAMRAKRPDSFPRRSLVTVFLFQAFLIWAVSIPAQVAQVHDTPVHFTALDFLG